MISVFFHRVLQTQAVCDYSDLHDPTRRELEAFLRKGRRAFRFVTTEEIAASVRAGELADARWVHLSMDDGFASSLCAAELCQKHHVPLTVFALSAPLDGFTPWFVRRVCAIAQARGVIQFRGEEYDTLDFQAALRLHDRIKAEAYSLPASEQETAWASLLSEASLLSAPVLDKFRFLTRADLRELSRAGVEIGSHGATHVPLSGSARDLIAREMVESKRVLEDTLGKRVRFLSYPEGLHDRGTLAMAADAGYSAAFAVEASVSDCVLAIPRRPVRRGTLAEMARSIPGRRTTRSGAGRVKAKSGSPAVCPASASTKPTMTSHHDSGYGKLMESEMHSSSVPSSGTGDLRIVLLTVAPQEAGIYCHVRSLIQQKWPGTRIVARVDTSFSDLVSTQHGLAFVVPAGRAAETTQQPLTLPASHSSSILLLSRGWQVVRHRLGITHVMSAIQRVLRLVHGAWQALSREFHRARVVRKTSAVRAALSAPSRALGRWYAQSLEQAVYETRLMLTPTAPLGLSDCDVLFPTDGDPDSLAAAVRQFAPDVIVQLGWGIVRSPLLDLPRWGILSWHHGIMPAIRGVLSPFWAVVRNRPEWLGVTIQRLNAGLDTGQIVSQRHLEPIDVGSYVEAYARLDRYAVEMMMTVLSELSLGNHGVLSANPNPRVGTYLGFPGLVDVLMFKLNATRFFGRSARG